MAKVYISLTEETAELLTPFAEAFAGHDIMINPRSRTTPLDGGKSKMEEANEWGADLYIAVRHGSGLSVKAAGQNGGKSWELCEDVHGELVNLLPDGYEDKGVTNGDLIAEISKTHMTSVYVVWYLENDTDIVDAIAEPCLEWLAKLNSNPPTIAPDGGEDVPQQPFPDIPPSVTPVNPDDAELGKALRILIGAWKNG